MKKITCFCSVLIVVVSQLACSNQNKKTIDYQWINESKKLKSDLSPIGYWEINLKYPILNGSKDIVASINERIMELVTEFQCVNGGDFTFNSSLEYADSNLMSLKFERMWMCLPMPSPDSDQGVLNLNITKGVEIELANEVKSREAFSSIQDLAKTKNSGCDIGMLNTFSFDPTGFTFYQASVNHGETGCAIQIKSREMQPFLNNNSALKSLY